MNNFIGEMSGYKFFEDENIPIGNVYPTKKKDGNRLGKRKRNLEHSGIVLYKQSNPLRNCILVHPSVKDMVIAFYRLHTSLKAVNID